LIGKSGKPITDARGKINPAGGVSCYERAFTQRHGRREKRRNVFGVRKSRIPSRVTKREQAGVSRKQTRNKNQSPRNESGKKPHSRVKRGCSGGKRTQSHVKPIICKQKQKKGKSKGLGGIGVKPEKRGAKAQTSRKIHAQDPMFHRQKNKPVSNKGMRKKSKVENPKEKE